MSVLREIVNWREHFSVDPAVACTFIVIGMILDLFTLILQIRRNVRGYGNSGCTILPWFFSLIMVFFSREPVVFHMEMGWVSRLLVAALLTVYSSLCHLYVPSWHARWLDRKSDRATD